MSVFKDELASLQKGRKANGRRWVFVAYDQLTDAAGPLAHEPPERLGILLVECPRKAARRPYHKQKLAVVLANLRHFALEQARRGVLVRHVVSPGDYKDAVATAARELGPLRAMRPAERELRVELEPLVKSGALQLVPHEGFLTTTEQFARSQRGPPWRMDAFYRHVRRATGILMSGGKPVGGQFSYDPENRKPWKGEPPAPPPPTFPRDAIKGEVCALIRKHYAHHPGTLDDDALPATLADAEALWKRFLRDCLASFGPYEDALATRSSGLFHARVSQLLNLNRLPAARLVGDVALSDAPLASREGFVRQVLGWREFVRHVHDATDGFRALPQGPVEVAKKPGDGGYARWAGKPWPGSAETAGSAGGALPSALGAAFPLPQAYWGAPSGLNCLDTVVGEVWREGYSHHISRLMILSNLAQLLDASPRELTDWFWVAYADAYDWVVEPNVLGMGTFGAGDVMTTKPYVSGAAYIDRMSDYCKGCAFHPKTTCPITPWYWAYLARHEEKLAGNPRLLMPLNALKKRAAALRARDAQVLAESQRLLSDGAKLTPEALGTASARATRAPTGGAARAGRRRSR